MKSTQMIRAVVVAALCACAAGATSTRQGSAAAVPLDGDDITGVVTGEKGPEAGVWVIAETLDLPTRFVRIVVTDDRGRYLIPDLPKASYQRVGPRLRPGGFAQDHGAAGQESQSAGRACSESSGRRGVLPRRILAVAAARPREE